MKNIGEIIKKHLKSITEQVDPREFIAAGGNKLYIQMILKNNGPTVPTSITKRFIPKPNQKTPNELLNIPTQSFRYITNINKPNDLGNMPKSENEAINLVKSHPELENIPEDIQYLWVEQPVKGVFKAHIIYPKIDSTLNEGEYETENYMFFSNLKQIHRQCELLLNLDPMVIEDILQNGHDWADDHVSEAKNNMDQVFDFFMNKTNDSINESKSNKLCPRGIASAKSKFKVYPSAYANGHAVQVCKGTIKGLDGKKKCSGSYCSGKKTTNENITESKKDEYKVYHNTYTSAVNSALEYAEKKGFEYDKEETAVKIGSGPKKPSEGKTNKFSINLTKDGKPQRKNLQIQIYGMGDKYELNCYIN
jgi:hypothetical protein